MEVTLTSLQILPRFFFPTVPQAPEGQGLLTVEASRSYSDTLPSAGLLWTSDQPVKETST